MAIGEVALFDVSGRCVAMPSRRGERLFALVVRYFETGAGNVRCEGEGGSGGADDENLSLVNISALVFIYCLDNEFSVYLWMIITNGNNV
jgi:hypothetical protein